MPTWPALAVLRVRLTLPSHQWFGGCHGGYNPLTAIAEMRATYKWMGVDELDVSLDEGAVCVDYCAGLGRVLLISAIVIILF